MILGQQRADNRLRLIFIISPKIESLQKVNDIQDKDDELKEFSSPVKE
jgi:hypothetical protein